MHGEEEVWHGEEYWAWGGGGGQGWNGEEKVGRREGWHGEEMVGHEEAWEGVVIRVWQEQRGGGTEAWRNKRGIW